MKSVGFRQFHSIIKPTGKEVVTRLSSSQTCIIREEYNLELIPPEATLA
jgi:hypothetical protein